MGKIVNLNQYRKQRERDARKDKAATRRARFGRSKAERAEEQALRQRQERELDGKKLEKDED